MAPSTSTIMLIVFLVAFCAIPMILSSRVLMHDKSMDSQALFRKLGFDLPKQELLLHNNVAMGVDSSLREAPGGPDPHHHFSKPSGSSLREAPGGPDPHHHFSKPSGSSLREAPGGPDPHHHFYNPSSSSLREAPGGPDPSPIPHL